MSNDELEQVLIATFADEARERLETIADRLLSLEAAAGEDKRLLLEEILRETHSLKGSSRAVELAAVEAAAHRFEGLLSMVQSGELIADSALLNRAYDGVIALATVVEDGLSGRVPAERLSDCGMGMAPLSAIFDAVPSIVRNLASALRKEVELTVKGGDIEVNISTLKELRSALAHMIRNSVDHGIEDPKARISAGKRRQGSVLLGASRHAGDLEIHVCDDGAGIDVEKVKREAVERGLIPAASAERMSEVEALWLIFRSGLSTKERVSEISGRGVGLDVVRECVERLNGTIVVDSTRGQGTRFALRVSTGQPLGRPVEQPSTALNAGEARPITPPAVRQYGQHGVARGLKSQRHQGEMNDVPSYPEQHRRVRRRA